MFDLSSVLALFVLLVIATGIYFLSKRIKVSYTILLVLVGILLVPLVQLPMLEGPFGFISHVQLTPELLFYIFLPILIFESAFNMNVRRMIDSSYTIMALSILGLVIAALLIATGLYFLLPFVGINIPFIVALLFGAIISATDPVAVLSLFKEFGAPKRLTMIFEGESLFNDGTAVALFMVVLAVATDGYHGTSTILEGLLTFGGMLVLGVLFGLVMAVLFARAVRYTKANEFVTVTLLMISAHLVFILSEAINHAGVVHISAIIATTVTALYLGNQARNTLSLNTDEYLTKFIEHSAFVANSLVFLLAGLLFASLNVNLLDLWVPILVTVLVVAIVRAISVYAITVPLNRIKPEEYVPGSWQILLSWGSLRGALAIIVVMLIPQDFTVEGWAYAYSPRDFLLAITIGCILATLFIKAPFIGMIMRKLAINKPDPLAEAHEADLGVYYLLTEKSRFEMHKTKGFVREAEYRQLVGSVDNAYKQALAARDELAERHGKKLFEQSMHLIAIHIERLTLRRLYQNGEIDERMFRRINGKLNLQAEKIEYARVEEIDPTMYMDRKDVFDRLVNFMQSFLAKNTGAISNEEKLQYYRAQMIIARKAVKTLTTMQEYYDTPVFYEDVFDKIVAKYNHYRQENANIVDKLLSEHSEELAPRLADLAKKSLAASGVRGLEYLHTNGIVNEATQENIAHQWSKGVA